MRIGIVTYHRGYNYGVFLQAYATVKYLESLGHAVELIDYTNKHEEEQKRWIYKEKGEISGYVSSFIKNVVFGKMKYSSMAFNKAIELYPLSKRRYTLPDQMNDLSFDVLLVGSDQVWNPDISSGIDPVFLLMFGHAEKRISYASSLGSAKLSKDELKTFKIAFEKFNSISVREDYAKATLQPITNKEIAVVADPTFLLNQEQWITFADRYSSLKKPKEHYILTYFITPDKDRFEELVSTYARKFNLPVWSIQFSNFKRKYSNKLILGATPSDYINLFRYADLVITDSFHGTAFSINMNVNFISMKYRANPMRAINLLEKVGLSNRLDMTPEDYTEIDYGKVNPLLEEMRKESRDWLVHALDS